MLDQSAISDRFAAVGLSMDERRRRLLIAAEARSAGYGGISAAARATGVARSTISRGLKDLNDPKAFLGKVRRFGGGRIPLTVANPKLLDDLRALLEPSIMGDPMRPLLWVSKSHAKLAGALRANGYKISKSSIPKLLNALEYRRQTNRMILEGSYNPERDAQFEHINACVIASQDDEQPVISIDAKKKELIGAYKNAGTDYRPKHFPEKVKAHNFIDGNLGKVVPYGIYDITANAGWVSVGTNNDTAEFAVNSIRRWLHVMGRKKYPNSRRLLILADSGGSNGARVRLFKAELQKLADQTGLAVHVCHYPPGTSKWNKIEHKMFCQITQTWRGRPLMSCDMVVDLIASTKTESGLKILSEMDNKTYVKGIRINNRQMASLNITKSEFHPEWNYTISPRTSN